MNESDGYQIIHQLGSGLSGPVFLAETQFGRAAVRLYQPPPGFMDEVAARRAFFESAKKASALNQPRVVRVLEVIDEGGELYEVMEYVPHETLKDAMARDSYSPDQAIRLLRQMSAALHYAHQNGVVHGDLKPSNVFLIPGQSIKISDFAVSPRASQELSAMPAEWRHAYLAPEHLRDRQRIGASTDQYALAAIAYHLYTGRLPLRGELELAGGEVTVPSSIRPQLPLAVDTVLLKALDVNLAKRYGSCAEFMDAFEGAFRGPIDTIETANASPWRNRIVWMGAAVVSLLLIGLTFALTRHPDHRFPSNNPKAPELMKPVLKPESLRPASPPQLAAVTAPVTKSDERARLQPAAARDLRNAEQPVREKRRYAPEPTAASLQPVSRAQEPPDTVPAALPAQNAKFGLEIYSRKNRLEPGVSFSEDDKEYGELAQGDLSAVALVRGVNQGKLTLDWLINDTQQEPTRPVAPNRRVEYGNEPTAGSYKVILKLNAKPVAQVTFRITKK